MDNEIINDMSEEIYKQISEWLKAKKKELKLTREQIFDSDIPLVSRVLNNKRIKNKNPYLLTPTLSDLIVKNMNFKSTYELVWGEKMNQRNELLNHFFTTGIKYLIQAHDQVVNKALFNDFDYAYSKAMYDYIVPNATTDVHEIIHRYEFQKNNAIYNFVEKYLKELSKIHRQFFKDKITTKLDKNIKLFYDTVFLKYITNHFSQQGLNFYNLIIQVLVFQEKPLKAFSSEIENNPYFMNEDIDKLPLEQQIKALGGTDETSDMESAVNKVVLLGEKFIDSILENQNYLM